MSKAGKKKEPYKRKTFETRIPGLSTESKEPYIAIYWTMFISDAWRSLSSKAKDLYLGMRLEYKGGDDIIFNFNQSKWLDNRRYKKDNYKLFKSPNEFYIYRDELVELGFIEMLESGKNTRTKAVYRFSDGWQKIKGIKKNHDITKARETLQKKREDQNNDSNSRRGKR